MNDVTSEIQIDDPVGSSLHEIVAAPGFDPISSSACKHPVCVAKPVVGLTQWAIGVDLVVAVSRVEFLSGRIGIVRKTNRWPITEQDIIDARIYGIGNEEIPQSIDA